MLTLLSFASLRTLQVDRKHSDASFVPSFTSTPAFSFSCWMSLHSSACSTTQLLLGTGRLADRQADLSIRNHSNRVPQ